MRTARKWMLSCTLALSGVACAAGSEEEAIASTHLTFAEYEASLPRTNEGAYVVEGDILIHRREDLTDYYAAALYGSALILEQDENGVDVKWSAAQARDLSYCVSTAFGADHALVRDTLAAAAQTDPTHM